MGFLVEGMGEQGISKHSTHSDSAESFPSYLKTFAWGQLRPRILLRLTKNLRATELAGLSPYAEYVEIP